MMEKEVIEGITARLRRLEAQERAEMAGGVKPILFASLPAAGEPGRLRFVTDGRKLGEGPAAGTGVVVYDDGGLSWRRLSDDTAVAV